MAKYLNAVFLASVALFGLGLRYGYVAFVKAPHKIKMLRKTSNVSAYQIDIWLKIQTDAKNKSGIYFLIAIVVMILFFVRQYALGALN